MTKTIRATLDGQSLTRNRLMDLAQSDDCEIHISQASRQRLTESRAIVEDMLAAGTPVYMV